jgi:hypothetical protein
LNNGADEENYLLLQGRATIGGEKSAIPLEAQSAADDVLAELSHVQGGFVITSWSASIIVNDTGIDSATSVGLSDGDRVILEDRSFIFYAGAYDNGVPGLR